MNRISFLCILAVYTALFALIIANSPFDLWNAARAFLAVAAFEGHSTFSGQVQGPVYGQYYPPLAWWWYSVIGVFESPTSIIIAASTLNIVGLVSAIYLAIKLSSPKDHFPAFIVVLALWLVLPTTFYIISKVHVDAPAITLAVFSSIFLQQALETSNSRQLVFSAVLLALSIWVKQTIVFILAAQAALIFLRGSSKQALYYLLLCSSFLLSIGAVLSLIYGWENLQFHIIELPALTPNKPEVVWASIALVEALPPILLICLFALSSVKFEPDDKTLYEQTIRIAKLPIAQYCLIALFTVPISILARVRYGGNVNSSLYLPFVLIALGLWFSNWRVQNELNRLMSSLTLFLLTTMAFVQVGIVYPSHILKEPLTDTWLRVIDSDQRRANPAQLAYEYADKSQHTTYFPMYPLANWLANQTPGPFEVSVCEREIIFGEKMSRHNLLTQLGDEPSEIIYFKEDQNSCRQRHYIIKNYFPNAIFKQEVGEHGLNWEKFSN